jgi:adenylosuccinate synthase
VTGRAAWAVVDLGFGDAGKGTVVDFLARAVPTRGDTLVVRFNGGAQAGHTVVTPGGRHHTFAQFGAGTFVPGVGTHLGPAFVLHPGALQVEARHLADRGVPDALDRLTVDARARVITPFQQAAGRLRELARGAAAHGTCGVGVGETVADTLAGHDDLLTAADLAPGTLPTTRARLRRQQERKRAELEGLRGLADPRAEPEWRVLEAPDLVERIVASWETVAPLRILDPTAAERRLHAATTLVFEGAQGVLLDETWGFHPHTTWSDCTFAGALALLPDDRQLHRLGVLRTYATRHGAGPFPTWDPDFDRRLPEPHQAPESWQGAFRTGPFDLVLARYALDVCGGVDGLALTCLDRIASWPTIPLCGAYEGVAHLDPGSPDDLAHREHLGCLLTKISPVLDALSPADLPAEIAGRLGVPLWLLSRGPTAEAKTWLGASPLC